MVSLRFSLVPQCEVKTVKVEKLITEIKGGGKNIASTHSGR